MRSTPATVRQHLIDLIIDDVRRGIMAVNADHPDSDIWSEEKDGVNWLNWLNNEFLQIVSEDPHWEPLAVTLCETCPTVSDVSKLLFDSPVKTSTLAMVLSQFLRGREPPMA